MRIHSTFIATFMLIGLAACSDKPSEGTDTDATVGTTSTDTTEASTAMSSETSTSTGTSSDATTEATTGTSTVEPTSTGTSTGTTTGDSGYQRECQEGDFVCDDFGCSDVTEAGECYKPCTPDGEVGGTDSECDEPERPFCSQVGLAQGGDFSCNGCKHICMAEPANWCDFAADQCE